MNYFFYLLFSGIANLIAFLPFRMLYGISDVILYPIVYHIVGYRKKVVYTNLRNSFPEKKEHEIEAIAKKFYHHFCDLFVEIIKTLHLSEKDIVKRMHYVNPEILEDVYRSNKHAMVVLGHYANWEWGIALAKQTSHKFAAIYKPLHNPYFDQFMNKLRSKYGAELVTMKQTARYLTQNIQEGILTHLNFIADQSPMAHEIQYQNNFLNQVTPQYLGVEKLARKTKQAVLYTKYRKVKRGYYEVEIEKICDDASLMGPFEITDRHTRILESLIKEEPAYWLWSHRRWKNAQVS